MIRGSRVDDIVLYSDEIILVEPQQIGLVWLKVLNVSQRNWPVRRSVNLMFLNKDRSVRQKPGPRMAPGRSVVSVVCVVGGATSAEVLNQLAIVCGAPELGSPARFGRQPTGEAPSRQPEPVGSLQPTPVPKQVPLPRTAVRGSPVWKVWTPDTSQPPKTWPTRPCWLRCHGKSQTKFAVRTWRLSATVGP